MSEHLVMRSARVRRRWSARRWTSIGVAVLAIAAGVTIVGSRAAYDEWPWSSHPSALHVCGRNFIDEGAQSRTQIRAHGEQLVRVGSVPGLLNHGELWTTTVGQPLPGTSCHVVMWVRTSADEFESYALSGGP